MDKKLDLNKIIDQQARASVRWYGHVLRMDMNNFLRSALDLIVKWTRKMGRPKKTWLIAVVELSRLVEFNVSDAIIHSRWRLGVSTISNMVR